MLSAEQFAAGASTAMSKPKSARAVLLTGATGFLGASILQELLLKTEANVICLSRQPSTALARRTIQATLERYELWDSQFARRITTTAADISLPQLGLSKHAFRELADEIDAVYHCAAKVSLVDDYKSLEGTNVFGTKEIIRLAVESNALHLNYVSSLAIFNALDDSAHDSVAEDISLKGVPMPAGGYAQTKWVSEFLLEEATKHGLHLTVYRPGLITGDSRTGISNEKDRLTLFLRACIRARVAPQIEGILRITPVDRVSQSIVALSRSPESGFQRYHLLNDEFLTWEQLARVLLEKGILDEVVPYDTWLKRLRSAERVQRQGLSVPIALFSRILPFHNCPACKRNKLRKFEFRTTSQALQRGLASMTCTESSEDIMLRYIDRLITDKTIRN